MKILFQESGGASNVLMFTEVRILEDEKCAIPYSNISEANLFVPKNMICAGMEEVFSL